MIDQVNILTDKYLEVKNNQSSSEQDKIEAREQLDQAEKALEVARQEYDNLLPSDIF